MFTVRTSTGPAQMRRVAFSDASTPSEYVPLRYEPCGTDSQCRTIRGARASRTRMVRSLERELTNVVHMQVTGEDVTLFWRDRTYGHLRFTRVHIDIPKEAK